MPGLNDFYSQGSRLLAALLKKKEGQKKPETEPTKDETSSVPVWFNHAVESAQTSVSKTDTTNTAKRKINFDSCKSSGQVRKIKARADRSCTTTKQTPPSAATVAVPENDASLLAEADRVAAPPAATNQTPSSPASVGVPENDASLLAEADRVAAPPAATNQTPSSPASVGVPENDASLLAEADRVAAPPAATNQTPSSPASVGVPENDASLLAEADRVAAPPAATNQTPSSPASVAVPENDASLLAEADRVAAPPAATNQTPSSPASVAVPENDASLLAEADRVAAPPAATNQTPSSPASVVISLDAIPVADFLDFQADKGEEIVVLDSIPLLSGDFEGVLSPDVVIEEEAEQLHLDNVMEETDAEVHPQLEVIMEETDAEVQPPLETVPELKKAGRKKHRNPEEYKDYVAKVARYKGKEFINRSGKLRPARVMKPPCACRYKCSLRVTEADRIEMFECYNQRLGSKDRQWAYIRNFTTSGPVKKRTIGPDKTPKKMSSRKYFLESTVDGPKRNVKVCKKMFMNTLSIWDGVIDSAYAHINNETKTPTPDKRGRHRNRPRRTTEAQKQSARDHINSFPRTPSHYVRSKCKKEYLESGLSAAAMFRLYKTWCVSNQIPDKSRATQRQYKTVLDYEFNIGFFKPKKDRCQLCTLMKLGTRREREKFQDKFVAHFEFKKGAYKQLAEARKLLTSRQDVRMLCFDLQKVLPCPKSETSIFFYLNKLSVYNLTVYSSREHQGINYLWHSGIAKRGSNEIGTCVRDIIIQTAKEGYKEVASFSDSCGGQNRNRYIYAMLLQLAELLQIKIRHCFLEPGHTYNDADGVHARIEAAARHKDIYDLKEWVTTIKEAKVNGPKYKVKVLKRSDFLTFKPLVEMQNWTWDTTGRKVKWNKVKIVEAGYSEDGFLGLQYNYEGEKIYLNTNQRRGRPVNLATYQHPVAYPEKIPLKQLVITHLQKLCRTLAIPSKYHQFYNDIIDGVEPTEGDDDPEDEQAVSDGVDAEYVIDDAGALEEPFEREKQAEQRNDADDHEADDHEAEENEIDEPDAPNESGSGSDGSNEDEDEEEDEEEENEEESDEWDNNF